MGSFSFFLHGPVVQEHAWQRFIDIMTRKSCNTLLRSKREEKEFNYVKGNKCTENKLLIWKSLRFDFEHFLGENTLVK